MKSKVFSRETCENAILLAVRDSIDQMVETIEFSWYSGGILNPDLDLVDVIIPNETVILLKKLTKIKSCMLWSIRYDIENDNLIFTFIRK